MDNRTPRNIATELADNNTLTHLDISNNGFDHNGLILIADAAAKNDCITTLKLGSFDSLRRYHNRKYQKELAAVLENNYSITDLSVTFFDNVLSSELQAIVDRNREIRFKRQKPVSY